MIQKLNQAIHNNIFAIALYLSIVPLLLLLLKFFVNYEEILYLRYVNFNPVSFSFLGSTFFYFQLPLTEDSFIYVSVLKIFFNALFLTGSILYFKTNKNEKRLLQFAFSIVLISSFIDVLGDCLYFFKLETIDTSLFFSLFNYIVFYTSYIVLKHLKDKDLVVVSESANITNHKNFKMLPSTKGQRFLHYIIDSFLVIILFSGILVRNTPDFLRGLGERNIAFGMFFFASIIYYLFFESILKTTPGKYLTQSVVKSLNTKPVTFSTILGRTFARHIPFNTFSFFGNLGWHDSISNTIVVQNKRSTKYTILYWAVFVIFIILIISKLVHKLFFW